jgi:hypothetical protein
VEASSATVGDLHLMPQLLRLAGEGLVVGSEAEKEMRYVQACVTGLVPIKGARWGAPDPKECHAFFGNPGEAKEQIRELIFGPPLDRSLARDFEAVREGVVEGGIPVPSRVREEEMVEPVTGACPPPPPQIGGASTQWQLFSDPSPLCVEGNLGNSENFLSHAEFVAGVQELLGAVETASKDGGKGREALEKKLDTLLNITLATSERVDRIELGLQEARQARPKSKGKDEVPKVDLAAAYKAQVKAVASTKIRPLLENSASLIGTDPKVQAAKVEGLNRVQLATLLEDVHTYISSTMTTLAAKGLTAPGKGFEIKMVLDPLVLCALATGLSKVPGFEDKEARKAWTRMLLTNKKDPCVGCGVELKGGQSFDHPGNNWSWSQPNKVWRGHSFPSKQCRPVVRGECLCNEVLNLYRATTRNDTPRAAVKAHSEEACPLGVNFSQVGKWAEWLRANPEAEMVCSPVIFIKGQSGYTDV